MTNKKLNKYFLDKVTLEDEVFESQVIFEPILTTNNTLLNFINCTFNGFCFLECESSDLSIIFENCRFENHSINIIENIECQQILFRECTIGNFIIQDSKISKLSFNWGRFDNLDLKNITGDSCELITNRESDKLTIDLPYVKSVSIESHEAQNSLFLINFAKCQVSGIFNTIILYCNDFESLILSQKKSHGEKLSKVQNFCFKSTVFKGKLLIEQFEIGTLQLQNLTGVESSLTINESTIERTHIIDCNFQEFSWNQIKFIDAPIIKRSNLRELVINDVRWPNNKKLRDSKLDFKIPVLYNLRNHKSSIIKPKQISENQTSDLKYEKDTYRQLKIASKNNENIHDYLLFGNYEKRLHWKLTRIEGGEKWYDFVLLFTDRFVSNFGLTWWMPLLWLFFFHYLLYFISIEFDYSFDKEMLIDGFNQSIVLINPAHSTPDYMEDEGYQWVSLLMRISSGFFIYHFLRATRKFARY